MTSEARYEYGEQLRQRKVGVLGGLPQDATLVDAKPHFYADAHLLVDEVRNVYESYKESAPPYGLFDNGGSSFTSFSEQVVNPWVQLERVLSYTARRAFEEVEPPSTGCPYHKILNNIGSVSLQPDRPRSEDIERLREIAFPGAQLAPATIVNILRIIPAIAAVHQVNSVPEALARSSARTLLSEPLRHPQQHAKAFTFSISDGYRGSDLMVDRSSFMPRDVIEKYTQIGQNALGLGAVEWSMPTEEFTLRADVRVANRLEGSETEAMGDHVILYPAGTKLGDIEVNEPTIGCPGSQLAYDMWDKAIDVIVGEKLWDLE